MEVMSHRLRFIGFPVYKKENIKGGTTGSALAASSYIVRVFKSG